MLYDVQKDKATTSGAMRYGDRDPRATELEKLRKRFRDVAGFDVNELKGLIIDEISFVQPELLGRVSRLSCRPFEVRSPYRHLCPGHGRETAIAVR